MTSAVDGLKQRFLKLSQLDSDGIYRHGSSKREERTKLAIESLQRLWNDVSEQLDFALPQTGVGLAAVGSLARAQIGPSSDLDLVLIVEPRTLNDEQLNSLANGLWYPLWDSGLDLDHSVRTKQQCESVTDSDLPAAVGWLNVLPLAGDTRLIEDISASILERWRAAARKRLPELLDSANSRLSQFGQIAYLNQPDIKEARGGLRDAVLIEALAASWLVDKPHGKYDEAVQRLLDIRDCLQLVANKDTNLMLATYQPRVAAMMGLADPTLPDQERDIMAIDDLQMQLAGITRQIAFAWESTSSRAAHTLTHERPRFAFFQTLNPRSHGKREAPRFVSLMPSVVRYEDEVALSADIKPSEDGQLPLRVALAAAEYGLPINALTLQHLTSCPIRDRAWSQESRDLFVRLLGSGPALLDVWEELDAVDIPSRWIPEWSGVRNRPSASAAHRYTIDRHMVDVVSRLGTYASVVGRSHMQTMNVAGGTASSNLNKADSGVLVMPKVGNGTVRSLRGKPRIISDDIRRKPSSGDGHINDSQSSNSAAMSGLYDDAHRTALLLAGLLHDIGKRPGARNHAEEGARHVPVIVRRMGFDDAVVHIATVLVREHLTLSEYATAKDPRNPVVTKELAARLDYDPILLNMLFDLTRADGSSLGATAGEVITKRYGWSGWRETLVHTMMEATRSWMHS